MGHPLETNHPFVSIYQNPKLATTSHKLAGGQDITFLPMQAADSALFGQFLAKLSEETRSKWRPHDFTLEVARQVCSNLVTDGSLRLMAITAQHSTPELIAYFILDSKISAGDRERFMAFNRSISETTTCRFAPAVADAYQNAGIGSLLMPTCLDIARRVGYQQMILMGGVLISNHQAVRFYEKSGFEIVGTFSPGPNKEDSYDMILRLT